MMLFNNNELDGSGRRNFSFLAEFFIIIILAGGGYAVWDDISAVKRKHRKLQNMWIGRRIMTKPCAKILMAAKLRRKH